MDPAHFVSSLAPDTRQTVEALRSVVSGIVPQVQESVVWGSLSYHRPEVGGRVKGAVCQIVVRRGEVRLDFIHGVRLEDPSRLLQGDGKSKRYVPVPTPGDAERPEVAELIRHAADLDPEEWAWS